MQHTINDINLLPTPTQLRKISQSLAMLDAILMPEWSSRYFSFDKDWDSDFEEMMASMKTGEGDEYYILFRERDAIGKVYSSEISQMSSNEILEIKTEASQSESVSYYLESFMDEEAFDIDNTSFLFWRSRADKSWEYRGVKGELTYLRFLMGDATFYKEWAEEYYETYIDLDVVKKIMKQSPLKSSMVEVLNSDITMKDLEEDIDEIGYPVWKKKGKRKTLPDNFQALLDEGDIEKLKKVFDICELDAYDYRFSKTTAITYSDCPDELVRWLVEKGLDINILDYYDNTPLYHRAGSWHNIGVFLELGADVNLGYPLHNAVSSSRLENTKLLLEAGADANKKNEDKLLPLELLFLQYDYENMIELVNLLLKYGSKKTTKMKKYIQDIAKEYELYRTDDSRLDETGIMLEELYKIFDMEPVRIPKIVIYDGTSDIVITEKSWKKQNAELYRMLVPSSGCASTVQGEVIRIANRIGDEITRNGGVNWDSEYKKMAKAFVELIGTGKSLDEDDICDAKKCIKSFSNLLDDTTILIKLAVKWVGYNGMPIVLPKPNYNR